MTLGVLRSGADITVAGPNGAFTVAFTSAADYVNFFKAAQTDKVIKAENGMLVIADA